MFQADVFWIATPCGVVGYQRFEGPYAASILRVKRFEAFIALKIQVEVFWAVTPCSVVIGYQRFGGPCCIHLQVDNPQNLI
jgi:hypothetical protein